MLIYSNEHVNSFEEDNVMKLYNVQTDYKVKKKAKQIKSEMSSGECQECCVKKETSSAWIGNSKTSNQACRDSPWIPDVLDSQIYRCTPSLASW